MENSDFMKRAIEIAKAGMNGNQGGPFGAVVVKEGMIRGEGCNQVTSTNDPTAHAEVVAIRHAGTALNTFDLSGCDLYTSCEPCPMCLSAALWARIGTIFYAATQQDAADIGFDDHAFYEELGIKPKKKLIRMTQISRKEAVRVMSAWREKSDKTEY